MARTLRMAVVNAILGWKNEGDRKQDRGWAGHGPEDRPGPQPQASLFSEIFFSLSFPSSSKLQKSLLKSNSGLSRSVGNRGRSQKNGTGERGWCPCPLRPDGGRRRCRVSRGAVPSRAATPRMPPTKPARCADRGASENSERT